MTKTEYSKRGRNNPYDAYIAGCCIWYTPRQLVLLQERLSGFTPTNSVDADAYADMLEKIQYEADIKRKKYLGG